MLSQRSKSRRQLRPLGLQLLDRCFALSLGHSAQPRAVWRIEGLLVDIDLVPRRVANDHVKSGGFACEYLGKRQRPVQYSMFANQDVGPVGQRRVPARDDFGAMLQGLIASSWHAERFSGPEIEHPLRV